MNDEELIQKIRNMKLPSAELKSHRNWLKSTLLKMGQPEVQHGTAIWKQGKLKIEGVKDTMIKALKSPQPIWKPLASSVIVIAIVVGLILTVSPFNNVSTLAMAKDIITNNPDAMAAIGDEDFDVVGFTISDGIITVVCENTSGEQIVLTVNMITLVATRVADDQITITRSIEVRDYDKDRAIDIAKSDLKVQDLFAQGAEVIDIQGVLISEKALGEENVESIDGRGEMRVIIHLKCNEENWLVYVDMWREKVDRLTQMPKAEFEAIRYIEKRD